tara:strand:+ start:924 stop:1679 length:756 start_codon:yes stop_codon:yes gene_type:complete
MVEIFQFNELKSDKVFKRPKIKGKKYNFNELEEVKFKKGKEGGFSLVYGQEKRIEGKKFLEAAKKQAKLITEEAENKASEIEKTAYEKGEQKVFEDSKQKLEPVLEMFQQKINELIEQRKELFINAEKEVLELAVSLAQKVIHHEVRTRNDVILGVIRSATKKILGREQIIIRINPDDMEFVLRNKPALKDEFKDIPQVSFKEDTSITKGGCIIDTSYGSIRATLEEEFEELVKHLNKEQDALTEKKENGA